MSKFDSIHGMLTLAHCSATSPNRSTVLLIIQSDCKLDDGAI